MSGEPLRGCALITSESWCHQGVEPRSGSRIKPGAGASPAPEQRAIKNISPGGAASIRSERVETARRQARKGTPLRGWVNWVR